ncbi:hypothetical protein C8R46DRAFT_1281547 [Mycena filopes]|nr:hypothetical protein C8R46DRAFT_1281547 [Mycena filopes]
MNTGGVRTRSYHFKELKREVFGRVTQCRIGHGYTGEYYSRRKFVPSEGVDCPSEEFQSREHILRECPRYEDQRHILEAVSRDISLPEILSTKEGIADEDDEDEVFLQRPSNPQQPLPIENWHLQPDCLHLLDGRVRSTLPPMCQSLVRRARTPGLHRASSVPFPPSIESNAPISSDLTVAWRRTTSSAILVYRSLRGMSSVPSYSVRMHQLLHIETPLAQTPADDALDSPSAFAPHVFDIQSPKCLPLLGENGQNSPMCIAPTRPAHGSTQGSARSQALVLSTSPRNPRRRWNRRAICFDHGRIRSDPVLSKPLVEGTRHRPQAPSSPSTTGERLLSVGRSSVISAAHLCVLLAAVHSHTSFLTLATTMSTIGVRECSSALPHPTPPFCAPSHSQSSSRSSSPFKSAAHQPTARFDARSASTVSSGD